MPATQTFLDPTNDFPAFMAADIKGRKTNLALTRLRVKTPVGLTRTYTFQPLAEAAPGMGQALLSLTRGQCVIATHDDGYHMAPSQRLGQLVDYEGQPVPADPYDPDNLLERG